MRCLGGITVRFWILISLVVIFLSGYFLAVAGKGKRESATQDMRSVEVTHVFKPVRSPQGERHGAATPKSSREISPSVAPPVRNSQPLGEKFPVGAADAILAMNFYRKGDILRAQHLLAREEPAVRADMLYSLLASRSLDDGLVRDKVLLFARDENSAAMIPLWTALLDREIPRSSTEVYFHQSKKPLGRIEAVDLAVIEQLRAIDGLAKIAQHDEEATRLLWEVALNEREMPFQDNVHRLAAVRGLVQVDPKAYLKLSRLLSVDDRLRSDLAAVFGHGGVSP